MKRKIALLLGILLFSGFLLFFVFDSGFGSVQDVDTLEPGSFAGEVRQAKKLYSTLGMTLDASEIRLCFRDEELACDRERMTFYLPVDMDSELWEAGTFTDASGAFSVLPLEDYTALDKQQVVKDGQAVPFLVWDETAQTCAMVQVVFTGLPVVRMETDADLDVDTVFAGSVVFYENCGQQDWTVSSVFEAHERGQTTRAYPKKGYRVNLVTVTSTGVTNKNETSVLGMRTSDSWIFYAIYSDGTKVRDKFNTELWNRFGAIDTPYDAHYGTHMEYVELVVNGEYRGLYAVMEPIDTDQLEISDQEYLYKRTFGRELLSEVFDQVEPEDYLSALGVEIKGKNGAGKKADWECFREFVTLTEADDETFADGMENLLDPDNVADLWLYLQMVNGGDNIYKNMFFAFKRENGAYRMYLVPWDMDLTWGNVYTDDADSLYVMWAPETAEDYLEWPLAERLFDLDVGNLTERVLERWEELRADILSEEELENLLDACIHQVQDSGAFARDAARWPDSSHDGDYDGLRAYMEERLEFMDALMQK